MSDLEWDRGFEIEMSDTTATNRMFSDRDLYKLIVPLVIEQALTFFVGVADTMMVSYAGEAAMSGVSLVDMYTYLISTLLIAVGGGGAVVVSQYIGHKDQKQANDSAGQLLLVALISSVFLMAFTLLLRSQILHLFYPKVEEEVGRAALRYMLITGLSYPFLGIYNASAALFRSMKKTTHTMAVSIVMNVINVAGNAIGIFVLHAGVDGVAVPTLISRMAACFIMAGMLFMPGHPIRVSLSSVFRLDPEHVRRVLHIAVPNSIENGLFALGRILVTSIVALFGTHQIAASSAALSIGTIAIMVCSGNNLACVTVIGQCVGADEYDQAEYYMKRILRISYAGNIIITVIMQIFLNGILGFYDLSPEAVGYAYMLVTIHNVAACIFHPTSFNLANGLRATGDAAYTMKVGMISMLFFRVGAAYLFGVLLNFQVIGVWMAMVSDWTARSCAFLYRFRSGKWREHKAI